ncbi:MAG: DUF2786 domain-containing protein [Halothiobacillus sp.]|jgi:hypothetical protein|nr:DUF2786 domain-containing protein [Halothiobacillus sp.]
MPQIDRKKLLEKIRKCLALSKSSNEHEAAAALRQAQKLMAAYNVTEHDVLASEASESGTKASAGQRPSDWETNLVHKIAAAFGCDIIFSSYGRKGEWRFVGVGSSPEIASYAFSVLLRQIKEARASYIKKQLRRCNTSTKIRRADLFCTGWVLSATSTIKDFAGTEEQATAINAYLSTKYPALNEIKPTSRNQGRELKDHEIRDYRQGLVSGRNSKIHHGVDGHNNAGSLQHMA